MRSTPSDTNKTLGQFIRFIVVGVLNTVVGFALYAVLVGLFGLPPQPALAIAFALGVLWNYFTHARFVFGGRGLARLIPYVFAYLFIYGLNALALGAFLRAGYGEITAQAILAPLAAVVSFFLIARVLTGKFPLFSKGT